MTSAPHPTPTLSLGPQIEVLLFVPPGKEIRQCHSDLEPAAGLSLSSRREVRLFLRSLCFWGPVVRKATQGQDFLVTSHPSCVPESLGRNGKTQAGQEVETLSSCE